MLRVDYSFLLRQFLVISFPAGLVGKGVFQDGLRFHSLAVDLRRDMVRDVQAHFHLA